MAVAKIQTGLRLEEKTYNKLKTLSIQEWRSLNNLAEYILKKYLENFEAKNGPLPEYQD